MARKGKTRDVVFYREVRPGEDSEGKTPSKSGPETITVDAEEAARLLGISRTSVYKLNAAKKFPESIKVGGLTKWDREELIAWFKAKCPTREKWEAMKRKK